MTSIWELPNVYFQNLFLINNTSGNNLQPQMHICPLPCTLFVQKLTESAYFWKADSKLTQMTSIWELPNVYFQNLLLINNTPDNILQPQMHICLLCIAGEEYILNIYIWQLSNWGHLLQFGICFLGLCWRSQFLLKGCAWEWTNMHLRLKVVLHCNAGEEYILKIYIWQRSNWGHLRQFGISFLKNMLTQQIFAQRVCMGVDKYAFEVEGCSPLYCWWGVHFENIRLATLKLRSFASIWNLFFRTMLAQPIFAQRVCMGVDKYAFEVEGYSPLYCWWGVHFENIHLATLKLRSFASIWNLFFKNICWLSKFLLKGCAME